MKTILVHGLGQNKSSWEEMLNYTSNTNFEAVELFDLIKNGEVNYNSLYKEFEKYCNSFEEEINLCGLSLGAILALDYAINNSTRVNKLILIGVAYQTSKVLINFQTTLFKFIPKSKFDALGLNKSEFITLCKTTLEKDLTNVETVSSSTLIIYGKKDKYAKKPSMKVNALIKDSKVIEIIDADHEVNKSNPKQLALEIEKFFNT